MAMTRTPTGQSASSQSDRRITTPDPSVQTEAENRESISAGGETVDDRCSRGVARSVQTGMFSSVLAIFDHTATVISDYIAFCEDMIIPKKLVKSFPNSKPWITKELKKTVSQKERCVLKER